MLVHPIPVNNKRRRRCSRSEEHEIKRPTSPMYSQLSKSCQYPVNSYTSAILPGLSTISSPFFTIPSDDFKINVFEDNYTVISEPLEKLKSNDKIIGVSALSNLLAIVDLVSSNDVAKLTVIQYGHTQYFYNVLLELFPHLEAVEVWSRDRIPISNSERLSIHKGIPTISIDSSNAVISVSDHISTALDLEYQRSCIDNLQCTTYSLFYSEGISGLPKYQCISSQSRIVSSSESTEIMFNVEDSTAYHDLITRQLWPWSFEDIHYISFDEATSYQVLKKYYEKFFDVAITADVLQTSLLSVKNSLSSALFRPKFTKK